MSRPIGRFARAAAGLSCAILLGCAAGPLPRTVRDPRFDDLLQGGSGWTGGDGCSTLAVGGGRVLWLFSDSTIGEVVEGRHAPGTAIVNNSAAIGLDDGPLRFAWGAGEKPHALFTPTAEGVWYWMAGGGAAQMDGPSLHLFLWRMGRTGRPDAGVWDFELRGTDTVRVDNPGDPPQAWRWSASPVFGPDGGKPGHRRAWGASVLTEGRWSTIFGVDVTDPARKGLLVARCPAGHEAEIGAWEYRAQGGRWSPDAAAAEVVAADAVDEFSVLRPSQLGGKYLMIQMAPNLGRRVLARTASAPEGPWSDGTAVWDCPEPASDPRLLVYTARAHPEFAAGAGLLVSYCVNSTDFWHMLGDASVYRPRFIRVPWALVEGGIIPSEKAP